MPPDPDRGATGSSIGRFVAVAGAAAILTVDIAFHLGSYGEVLYYRTLAVLALATVLLVASFLEPNKRADRHLMRVVYAIPLVWVLLGPFDVGPDSALTNVLEVLTLLTLPILLYSIARYFGADFFDLGGRFRLATLGVLLVLAVSAYLMGRANDRYFTCHDFEVAGAFQPENCLVEQD